MLVWKKREAYVNLLWIAESDLSMEISRIEYLIQLIHRSVDVYRIEEIRQKPSSLIGLEEEAHALVSRLINEPNSVVSIVGMPEIGKTTLAKIVSEHSAIREHFAYRAWVSIPEQYRDNALHDDVANQVPRTNWLEEVKVSLKEKNCLLVLDNISTKEAWDSVQVEFSKKKDGSKILLTTRDRKVASDASQNPTPHHLRLRTKEESWQLFIHKVQFPPDLPSEVEALPTAKKLVEICGGLTGAIEILVDKISGKDCLTRWSEDLVMDDPPHGLNYLISCLMLFPGDFEIPARRVIALWAAESIPADGNETVEDVTEKKLLELIDLNIIRVVQKKINGKIKACQLPGFLRERCLSKFVSSNGLLADHFHSDDASFANIHGTSKITPTDLCSVNKIYSFLSFDFREGNKPGEDIGNFLRRTIASFRLLRVLDLELVFRPQLPNSIGNLIELRYLGLRWTYLETIPSSIGKLLKLQILDVKHTCLRTISRSIWKLKKLPHLYLNESYRSKFMHQPSASFLKNLQTLWGAFVDEDSPLHDGLRKLTNLRKLGLALELTPSQQERLAGDVAKLKNLLRLRSIDKTGKPQDLCLGSLKDLENLSSLYLFGRLTKPYIISEFPQGLSDLTLSGSGLKDDPMTNLCKLPNLKSLCFYLDSYEGQRMVCTEGGFPQLLVLKFWKLEKLQRWNVMERGMQNLRELEIRSCKRLEVPTGLNHLKTLRELTLTDVPEKLAETIKEKRNDIFRSVVALFPVITVKKLASS
ncbi:LOW QUALITY PROTEIN: inactive disease susceptibility protein LOV1-like [Juglans microcarpa x Juglans regia]|uniref:LOW QUALITY PROTEIN: inactive disease susceptibility protein LOV1-like n=1 Tax=Juglans microcarpa x Juglans regia TaxID=2249226 RepID=UPI001B7DB1F4|nr:LOW QUALITY PROTEIN: inactive disease susceptibility protein LOV1-like [Juglans microcarpa x Juglans regia]